MLLINTGCDTFTDIFTKNSPDSPIDGGQSMRIAFGMGTDTRILWLEITADEVRLDYEYRIAIISGRKQIKIGKTKWEWIAGMGASECDMAIPIFSDKSLMYIYWGEKTIYGNIDKIIEMTEIIR